MIIQENSYAIFLFVWSGVIIQENSYAILKPREFLGNCAKKQEKERNERPCVRDVLVSAHWSGARAAPLKEHKARQKPVNMAKLLNQKNLAR